MSAIQKYSRFEVLISQFPFEEDIVRATDKEALARIFHFLYHHTDIHYLVFLKAEMLIQYLKHHSSNQFKIISFIQAIRDIKVFLLFLKNTIYISKVIDIDLSVRNYKLWIMLYSCYQNR